MQYFFGILARNKKFHSIKSSWFYQGPELQLRGVTLIFFVKLDFEIAVDQQTKARDRTFEGVLDSGSQPVPTGQPRPYFVNFWPTFTKSP